MVHVNTSVKLTDYLVPISMYCHPLLSFPIPYNLLPTK